MARLSVLMLPVPKLVKLLLATACANGAVVVRGTHGACGANGDSDVELGSAIGALLVTQQGSVARPSTLETR
eukprot:2266022-Amphidinium_carterae.1